LWRFTGRDDGRAGRVHGHGFSINTFAGVHRRLEMHRPEFGEVAIRTTSALVSSSFVRRRRRRNATAGTLYVLPPFGPVLNQSAVATTSARRRCFGGLVAILQGPGTPAAAADQGHAELLLACAANITFLAASTLAIPTAEVLMKSRRETLALAVDS
jgi:hypothetical protein